MGSSRLPGKSLAEINGRPTLSYLMAQLSYCRAVDEVVLAIPDRSIDDSLAQYASDHNWRVFRGSELDVLGRYHGAAVACGAGPETGIIRLCGDDILIDPLLVDAVANLYQAFLGSYDFVSTDRAKKLPYGAAVELMSFEALTISHREATESFDREHVVPFVKWKPERFRILELTTSVDLSDKISLAIDTELDLQRNRDLIMALEQDFSPPYHITDILSVADSLRLDGTLENNGA
jgi:spore coat polysaccharide biosynthesis protein SpsF